MRDFRAPYLIKAFASGLIFGLLISVFAPLLHVQKSPDDDTFSDWLRSQVPAENDEHFNEALAAAEAQNADYLTDFIRAFVDAHPSPDKLAAALSNRPDSDLFSLLTRSSETLGNVAVFPRLVASVASVAFSLDRIALSPVIFLRSLADVVSKVSSEDLKAGEMLVYAFPRFSNAQPLGP